MLSNFLKILRLPVRPRVQTHNLSKSLRVLTQNIENSSNFSNQAGIKCETNNQLQRFENLIQVRHYSNPLPPSNNLDEALIDGNTYEIVCNETLEALCEYFDEIIESNANLKDADIIYGDGVLTVKLGSNKGTYVINRQSPNRQIWLSSPISGPKRYDFIPLNDERGDKCEGYWLYKHEDRTLHELLQEELPKLIGSEMNFLDLSHGKR